MLNIGQIYKERQLPSWRKHDADTFAVTMINRNSVAIIYTDGTTDYGGRGWILEDCDLIAEYPTWQEAVNSKEFNNA